MSNAIYKKDLHDVALAVAQGSKNYTDKVRDSLRWEFGTYDLSVETINGTTMLLPTPANTIQATMVRVDGNSEVSENLIVLQDVAETVKNGLTYKIQNGVVYIKRTSAYSENVTIRVIGDVDLTGSLNIFSSYSSTNLYYRTAETTYTPSTTPTRTNITIDRFWLVVGPDFNESNYITVKPMLVKGSTAPTEFSVGFEGIHNFAWNGLKVEGANLFTTANKTSGAWIDTNGVIQSAANWNIYEIEALPNTTYYLSGVSGTSPNAFAFAYNGTTQLDKLRSYTNGSFTTPYGTTSIKISARPEAESTLMLNYGSTALAYVPYVAPTTLPIDLTSIEDSGGNKLFADGSLKDVGTAKDYITPYKAGKEAEQLVVDSNTRYNYIASNFGGCTIILDTDKKTTTTNRQVKVSGSVESNIDTSWIGDAAGNFYIKFITPYESEQALKQALLGTIFIYNIATPIEADIDLSQFVKFEAYSNGSITLVNTNNQDTTSTFKYLKEVAK